MQKIFVIDKLFTEAVLKSWKDRESCKKLVLMSMQHYPSFFFLCMLSMWNIIWTNHERLLTAQESIRAMIFNWLQSVMMTRLIRINLRVSAESVCIVIKQPFAKKRMMMKIVMIKKNLRGRRRSNKVSKTFRLPFSQTNAACNAEYSPETKIIQIFRFFYFAFFTNKRCLQCRIFT